MSFLYPLETSENRWFCFQEVQKGNTGLKLVKILSVWCKGSGIQVFCKLAVLKEIEQEKTKNIYNKRFHHWCFPGSTCETMLSHLFSKHAWATASIFIYPEQNTRRSSSLHLRNFSKISCKTSSLFTKF